MFLDLKPRMFARMQKLESGGRVPNPNKKLVTPKPFGPERAKQIVHDSKAATISYGPWTDKMRDMMTDEEIVYVLAVWDCCDGSASFLTAFNRIQNNNVPEPDPYFEKGSRESLNVWFSSLPAPARKQFQMDYIGKGEYGVRQA